MKIETNTRCPITIQSHHESNHNPITESCDWGAWCTKCWRGGQCCPLPKLRPPAARGTLTPDIISQPVSPRPRKKDGSRFTNSREREKIRIARPSAGSIFLSSQPRCRLALDPSFFPHNGQTGWRWIHRSYPHRHPHTRTMNINTNA